MSCFASKDHRVHYLPTVNFNLWTYVTNTASHSHTHTLKHAHTVVTAIS